MLCIESLESPKLLCNAALGICLACTGAICPKHLRIAKTPQGHAWVCKNPVTCMKRAAARAAKRTQASV